MGALAKIWSSLVQRANEGQYRRGPYSLPVTGGWLPDSWGQYVNWWQMGYSPLMASPTRSAMVEACVSAYSQTVAMMPGDHWEINSKGGRDRITTTSLSRLLRQPNDYQSISDFLLNAVRQLYLDGNAYGLCERNDRYEIDTIHLMDARQSKPQYAYNGEIFYQLGGNKIVEARFGRLGPVPMRDVLHIRLHTNTARDPLIGESPLMAAFDDIAAGDAIKQQQLQFFRNSAKPSFVLTTDLPLEKDVTAAVRERFMEMTTGENAGGVPILTHGLKPYPVGMPSREAQVAEILKMTNQDIALAYRIPLQILGLAGGAPLGSTEALMNLWLETGLGFCLEHVEEAFGRTFQLKGWPDDYVEFDTDALMRVAFKERISALKEGVQGGIFSPNEARNKEGLDNVPYGDEPRVQQQVVPLSAAGAIPSGPFGKPTIPASPSSPPAPPQPGASAGSKSDDDDITIRQWGRYLYRRSNHIRRSTSASASLF